MFGEIVRKLRTRFSMALAGGYQAILRFAQDDKRARQNDKGDRQHDNAERQTEKGERQKVRGER